MNCGEEQVYEMASNACLAIGKPGRRVRGRAVSVLPYPFITPTEFEPSKDPYCIPIASCEWILLRGREVLVKEGAPDRFADNSLGQTLVAVRHLGRLNDIDLVAAIVEKDIPAPEGWGWTDLRRLYGVLDDARLSVIGRAAQLLDGAIDQAFCGRCGARTTPFEATGRTCPSCHFTVFSRIEPAVIVAVRRKPNLILLARGNRLPQGMFSVLAGFVEPGESLEQCAAREVFEETAICIKNLRYQGSQSWPFPRSLMVGFLAEYDSGSIAIDPSELERADWFPLDALPELPKNMSISRWLIDVAIAEWKAESAPVE